MTKKNNVEAHPQKTENTEPQAATPAVIQPNQGLALNEAEQSAILDQELIAGDIKVPAILLGQPLSESVKNRQVLAGQMYRNDTLRVVGEAAVGNTPCKDINIIPMKIENIWQDYALNGTDKKWVRTYQRVAGNDNLDRDFAEGAQKMTRVKGVRLYGVLLEDAKAFIEEMKSVAATGGIPDLNKQLSPVSLLFKSGSFKSAASPTVKFFQDVKNYARQFPNMAPFLYALPVRAAMAKNQEGREYLQFQVLPQQSVNDPELQGLARSWFNQLKNATIIASDDDTVDGAEGGGDAIPATAKPVHSGNFI